MKKLVLAVLAAATLSSTAAIAGEVRILNHGLIEIETDFNTQFHKNRNQHTASNRPLYNGEQVSYKSSVVVRPNLIGYGDTVFHPPSDDPETGEERTLVVNYHGNVFNVWYDTKIINGTQDNELGKNIRQR